ncbi:MAG: PleD family two-component system response regulator [Candidatus Aquirickettsiella gammari]
MNSNIENALIRLRKEFIAHLPDQLALLEAQLAALERGAHESIKTLHLTVHSLVGAAGIHRLMNISDAARAVEHIVVTLPLDRDMSVTHLDTLRAAIRRLAAAAATHNANLVLPPSANRGISARIMVVVDDVDQTQWLRSILESVGYLVEVFTDLATFRAVCQNSKPPSAVIMDIASPVDDTVTQTITELHKNCLSQTPIIFLSEYSNIESKLAAYRAGATGCLAKPVNSESLLRLIAETVAQIPTQPYRVLLVDDDPLQLMIHSDFLQQAGMIVLKTDNPLLVPDLLEQFSAEARAIA